MNKDQVFILILTTAVLVVFAFIQYDFFLYLVENQVHMASAIVSLLLQWIFIWFGLRYFVRAYQNYGKK